jgi:hypothetical protein
MRLERPCLILLTGYLPAVPADRPAEGRLPRHRTNLRRSRGFDFTMPACWNKCSLVCIASLDLHGGDPRMSVAPTIQHVDQVYAVVDSKGAHPDGAVSASWKRSATNYNIDPASDDPPRILTAYELTGYTLSISFIRLTRATVLDQVRLDVFQRRPAGSAKCRCLSKNECSLRLQLEETPLVARFHQMMNESGHQGTDTSGLQRNPHFRRSARRCHWRGRMGCPHVEDLALPKSLRSGNFILARAIIRWMPVQNPA